MYILVDRANGQIITHIEDSDLKALQESLESESSEDFDFYITEATLAYLEEQGLREPVIRAFDGRLQGRGMDVGWERETAEGPLHTGMVVDDEGQPLGGIRVDLLDQSPMETGKLQGNSRILDWTYSREDGTFQLETTDEAPGTQIRLSGRGDLVLAVADVDTIGDQGEFTVQTITGTVKAAEGAVLGGVSVQLLNWNLLEEGDEEEASLGGSLSWGDTGEDGRFAIPVHLPVDSGEVVVQLEILAPSGQSLAETSATFDPNETFEIGDLTALVPDASWGMEEEEEGEELVQESTHRSFEHPLS